LDAGSEPASAEALCYVDMLELIGLNNMLLLQATASKHFWSGTKRIAHSAPEYWANTNKSFSMDFLARRKI
jgi:hypothetical protein